MVLPSSSFALPLACLCWWDDPRKLQFAPWSIVAFVSVLHSRASGCSEKFDIQICLFSIGMFASSSSGGMKLCWHPALAIYFHPFLGSDDPPNALIQSGNLNSSDPTGFSIEARYPWAAWCSQISWVTAMNPFLASVCRAPLAPCQALQCALHKA